MKLQLCVAIARNVSWLFSYDFWLGAYRKDFSAKSVILLVLFAAMADILRMVLVPGYPGKAAE